MHQETVPEPIATQVEGDRYGVVLVLAVLVGLLAPLVEHRWAALVASIFISVIVLRSAAVTGMRRFGRRLLAVLASVLVLGALLGSAIEGRQLSAWIMVAVGVLLTIAPVLILRDILSQRFVGGQTILGAICVYVLFGLVFSFWYVATNELTSGGLFVQGDVAAGSEVYFSFVALTTLGFGDLAPAGYVGRALVVLETMIGQVFLVTLLAWLVSSYGSERKLPDR